MNLNIYKNIIHSLFDGVYFVDNEKRIKFWNKAAERITGYTQEDVLGSFCSDNILRHTDGTGEALCLKGCPLAGTLQDTVIRDAEVFLHHKEGHRVPVSVRVAPIYDETEKIIIGAVEIFCDISRRDNMIEELEKLRKEVLLDELTGVGNRRLADIKLKDHMKEFLQNEMPFGVIFLDIDHFKNINDVYGHKVGDQVLVMVSKTISNLLRPMDIISRWGGEEFFLIVPNVDFTILEKISERIRIFVEKCWIAIGDENVMVTVSVGATLAQSDDTVPGILERVDSLMYESKRQGRNKAIIK